MAHDHFFFFLKGEHSVCSVNNLTLAYPTVTLSILPVVLRLRDQLFYLKKNQNAPRPSEHPPVRGGEIKTFRWDQRLVHLHVDIHIIANSTGRPGGSVGNVEIF